MHGNEVVGRELLLKLIDYMCDVIKEGYDDDDSRDIIWLLENTRMHFMPSMNPDGWELANSLPRNDKVSLTLVMLNINMYYTHPYFYPVNCSIPVVSMYCKTCLKRPLRKNTKIGFQYRFIGRSKVLQNAPRGAFCNTFDLH